MINYPLGKTNIIGRSLVIKRKINFIRKSSKSDKNVLIYVETGAGKEMAASRIHELSDRRKKHSLQLTEQMYLEIYSKLNYLAINVVLLQESLKIR